MPHERVHDPSGEHAAAPPRASAPLLAAPPIGNRALVSLIAQGRVVARQGATAVAAEPTREEKVAKFKAALADARDGTGTWDRVAVVLNGFNRADVARLTALLSKAELQTLRTATETELLAWGWPVQHVLEGIDDSIASKGAMVRPHSTSIWNAYDPVKYKPNGPGSWAGLGAPEVWDKIGGNVGNGFGPDSNSCAARLSYALNYGGMPIREQHDGFIYKNRTDRTDKKGASRRSGDGKKYIVSAWFMEDYLKKKWGKPDAKLKTNDDAKVFASALKPDQIAVFAGFHHVGVMRQYTANGYKDAYVFTDPGVMPVSAWVLK